MLVSVVFSIDASSVITVLLVVKEETITVDVDTTLVPSLKLNVEDASTNINVIDVEVSDVAEVIDTISSLSIGSMYRATSTFDDMPIKDKVRKALYDVMKFERPSQIQASVWSVMLESPFPSIIAQGHNGVGKTTCFVVGMLCRVDEALATPQAICVCVTRELVKQTYDVACRIGRHTGIDIYDASSAECDALATSKGAPSLTAQVVIGTMGKLKNLTTKRRSAKPLLPVDSVRMVVFDEADVMMDSRLYPHNFTDSQRFIKECGGKTKPQILLFSATFSEHVQRFIEGYLPDAHKVFVKKEDLTLDAITQWRVSCDSKAAKLVFLRELFPLCTKLCQTVVFVETRNECREIYNLLKGEGWPICALDGGMAAADRDSVVEDFRMGRTKIMVATNAVARGFDCTSISLVINYDPPVDTIKDKNGNVTGKTAGCETYMHRIGRSGRFGRKGVAFNLCSTSMETTIYNKIEKHFDCTIPTIDARDEEGLEKVLEDAGL